MASKFHMTSTMARRRPSQAAVRAVASLLLLALAACGGGGGDGAPVGPPPVPPPPTQAELDYASDVLDIVNLERTSRGLDPVVQDAAAAEAAFGHANDMAVRGFFDHVNPNGEDPGDRLDRAGAAFFGWAENIAQGQSTPSDVLDAWMGSAGHRANILSPSFGRLGVGVRLASGGPHWVQDFLAP